MGKRAKKEVRQPTLTSSIPEENFDQILEFLKDKYEIRSDEIVLVSNKASLERGFDRFFIPIAIFRYNLSPLSCVVKYLRENLELRFTKIAAILKRDNSTIWDAYQKAKKEMPDHYLEENSKHYIPITMFNNRKLSILESLVYYLKTKFDVKFTEIAQLTKRSPKTIWTSHDRAKKKLGNKEVTNESN
jgi:hypothetical protein